MDRPIVYSLEQSRTFDWLSSFKDYLRGSGRLAQAILGPTDTIVTGFGAAQQSVPNLSFILAAGQIMEWAPVDASPFGALPADTDYIYQQGYVGQQTIVLSTAQLVAGQSQWVLIRARFKENDVVRPGDPTDGVLPYYNSANPLLPLQGPSNNGNVQNTMRGGLAEISVVYGTPAATNSEVAPVPGGGYVGLYLVKLTFGQSTITNGQILACPAGIDGYPRAPFWMGVRAQHHKGTAFGQAPQIDLATEVANILPYANMNVSNQSPNAVGGSITAAGIIPIFTFGTVVPTGNVSGRKQDLYLNTVTGNLYACITTGTAGTAVWQLLTSVTTVPMKYTKVARTTGMTCQNSGDFYQCNFAAPGNMLLPPNPADGTVFKFVCKPTGSDVTIVGDGSELINNAGVTANTLTITKNSGAVELVALDGAWYVS